MMNVKINCGAYSKSIGLVASKEQGNERAKYLMEEYDHLSSIVNIIIGAVNTLAGNALIDAKNELYKRKDLWRHDVKFNAHNAEKEYYKYERLHTSNFGEKYNLFLDYLNAVEDEFKKDIQILKLSIWQVLTKNNQTDAKLKAEVETAWILARYAICVFDKIMEEAKNKTGFDYTPFFNKGRLTSTFHYWDLVDERICKADKGSGKISFDDDENCKLAFRIIEKKMMSEDLPNKAGYMAIKQNMDLVGDVVSKEDYEELAAKFEKE